MIEPGAPADIPAILEIERGEGFERQVGRWPAEQHLAEMAEPRSAYFVWREGGEVIGFVMLQEIDTANRSAYVRRIATFTRLAAGRVIWPRPTKGRLLGTPKPVFGSVKPTFRGW